MTLTAFGTALARPVPRRTTFLAHLGRLAVFLFGLEVLTGVLLAVYYRPIPEQAFESVRLATNSASFGWFVRGVHRAAGNGLVLVAGVALARAFFRRSFLERHGAQSWVIRVVLVFVAVLLLATGQMLPWTDSAYWRAVSAANVIEDLPFLGPWLAGLLRGGPTVNGGTLVRIYVLHALVLPWVAFLGLVLAHRAWRRRMQP